MYTKMVLIGLAMLAFTACATVSPTRRFAASVAAAQRAHRPLVVYRLYTQTAASNFPLWINRRYAMFTRVGFINIAPQPIKRVVFKLSAYNGNRPVLDRHGRPLTRDLVALGPFAAGSHQELVTKDPVWTSRSDLHFCGRLQGIQVFYADGSSVAVTASEAVRYLTPQISPSGCTYYPPGFAMLDGGAVGTGDDPDGDGPGR